MQEPTPAIFAGSLTRTFEYRTGGCHTTPQMRWTFSTHGMISCPVLVDQGVVYIADDQGYFSAIEARGGKLLWSFEGKHPITAICIEGNRGYIATSYDDYVDLFELDLYTGQLLHRWKDDDWQKDILPADMRENPRTAVQSLFVWDDYLILAGGTECSMLHRPTGKLFLTEHEVQMGTPFLLAPTVYQERIYGFGIINNNDSYFVVQTLPDADSYCWLTEDNASAWDMLNSEIPEERASVIPVSLCPTPTLPIVHETLFAVGTLSSEEGEDEEEEEQSEERLLALDPANGAIKWSYESRPDFLTAGSGLVFLQTERAIEALDIQTHQSRWFWNTKFTLQHHFIADSLLYVFDQRGQIIALDASTGEQRWHLERGRLKPLKANVKAVFSTIADGTLYVVAGNTLYALN